MPDFGSTAAHTRLRSQVVNSLRKAGHWAAALPGSGETKKGNPDVVACIDGRFFAIEIKTGQAHADPTQQHEHYKIQRAGGFVLIISDIRQLDPLLKEE